MRTLRQAFGIAIEAFDRFGRDDGWAIASHIALSMLMALFPFVIVVTALAGFFFGSRELADEAARILLEAWPHAVAEPIAADVTGVLVGSRGNVLTFGSLFALYFASSGIESLRIGLNRAYATTEPRAWWLLRIESVAYVLVGAVALLAFAFLVVLAPVIWAQLVRHFPGVAPFGNVVAFARYAVAATILVMSLLILHLWLPSGRRQFRDVLPGIAATLGLWLVSGELFGRYLAQFSGGYVTMYAGLASAMVALVFLYICASIFIYGGELNAAIRRAKTQANDLLPPA
ncbi:MAG: YihY/virulence factor BrkB family protein [Pseudolabrys sp.]